MNKLYASLFFITCFPWFLKAQILKDSNRIIRSVKVNAVMGSETAAFNLPASAHYLGTKELDKQKYTDIHRILQQVPGVNVQEEDGLGLRPNIGMRGTGSERSAKITIMEDGVLMAPAAYAAPSAYFFPTVARMQGVEVIKGSSQIRFGPNTIGGVLNFTSKKITKDFEALIDARMGNFGQRSALVSASGTFNRVGVLVQSNQVNHNGFKTLGNNENTGYRLQDYLVKLSYESKPTAKYFQRLSFKMGETQQQSNETYLGIGSNDFVVSPYLRYAASALDNIQSKHNQYVIQHQFFFNANTSINTSVYRTDFSRNWYKLDKVKDSLGESMSIANIFNDQRADFVSILKGENAGTLYIKANNRLYYNQGVQSNYQSFFETGDITHNVIVGFRLHQDQMDRYQWVDDYAIQESQINLVEKGAEGTESNRLQTATALAAYAQYELKYKNWRLIPGLRYENIQFEKLDYGKADIERLGLNLTNSTNQMAIVLPGMSLSYKPNAHWNHFVGIHKGFSPAGFAEEAKPEESWNTELGSKALFNIWSMSVVAFYSAYQNLLGADNLSSGGLGSGDMFNGGQARAYGLEASASINLLNKSKDMQWPVQLNYTYTRAQFLSDFNSSFDAWGSVVANDDLPYLPQHQLGFSTSFIYKTFGMHYNLKYQSPMNTIAGKKIASNLMIPAYTISDISFQYQWNKKVQFYTRVFNVFNNAYLVAMRPAGLRPGMPRSFSAGVKFAL